MTMFYSVMLECKLAQGTQEAFVRDVKAAPDPQCILYFDWQMIDMTWAVGYDGHNRAVWHLDRRSNV